MAWPGKVILTDKALYFEVHALIISIIPRDFMFKFGISLT